MAVAGWYLTPPKLINDLPVPQLPEDLDAYLMESERRASEVHPLIPDTEKRIRWQRQGEKTECSLVYLHGFSATRQEIAPTLEHVADSLNANLFETRLSGHGRSADPLTNVRAEDWLVDASEALAIGAQIGRKVVLVGTSTGATLAMSMTDHPSMSAVSALVLISPNFGPRDESAEWLIRPAGPLLARLTVGETRSWTARNEMQKRFWSTSYPTVAVVEMMRLVDYARSRLPRRIDQSVLVLVSPDDKVVSPDATKIAFEKIDSTQKQLLKIADTEDPSAHILAGRIMSPTTTAAVAEAIVEFLVADSCRIQQDETNYPDR